MTSDVSNEVLRVTAAVARHGLDPTPASIAEEPLDDLVWADLVDEVRGQRLSGLLLAAVADGSLVVTDGQLDDVLELHRVSMALSVALERDLLTAVDLLERGGVEVQVLKGSAVAHLDYPDPGLRCFGDSDVQVRAADFDRAVEVLTAAGYDRIFPQPRAGFDRRFSKGTSFETPAGFELDLHRTFVLGPIGLVIDLDEVWSAHDTLDLGDRKLRTLDRSGRFLHACLHAYLGDSPPRLVPLRDAAQMMAAPDFDADGVRARAARWRVEAVVAAAVSTVLARLGPVETRGLDVWARDRRPGRRETRMLAAYTEGHRSSATKAAAALRAIPGGRDKVAYLRALVFPDAAYVRERHGSRRDRFRRGVTSVVFRRAPIS